MIDTTVNIDINTYSRLTETAKSHNLKIGEIVHAIFNLLFTERPLGMPASHIVRRRGKDGGRKWKSVHLQLFETYYETCLEMRNTYRLSVSELLDIAVEMYLDRAVELLNSSDQKFKVYTLCNMLNS